MQHKWTVLFTTLILCSLLLAPVGPAQAQDISQDCPPYEPNFMNDKQFLRSLPGECVASYREVTQETRFTATGGDRRTTVFGGPDSFGYTYDDSAAYNWVTATTNSGLTGDDEFTGPINIGFNYPFYGINQSQLYFSTNGLISFGAGSTEPGDYDVPTPTALDPNNLIAPFWEDLVVGSPDNSGAIYYSQGGTLPNRYFVVEWRNVEKYPSSSEFSFEAILYENGDIVFQYQTLPSSFGPSVGIENSNGYEGLAYPTWSLSAPKALRYDYPAPAARVSAFPSHAGGFVSAGDSKEFLLTIANSGGLGADTYDLTMVSDWPVTLYASDGVTRLTDTDADTAIDTGSIPQGAATTVIARFSTPSGAQAGDDNRSSLSIKSSLSPDPSKTRMIFLSMSIPASFVSVFQDEANGAMSFMTASPNKANTYKATTDNYFAYNLSVTKLSNGNYFYAWAKSYFDGIGGWRDIEYALLTGNGNVILPAAKLTNNFGAPYPVDNFPSVAMAPNGTVGVVWSRRLTDSVTGQYNYNIYFATLDTAGKLLSGPTNVTNNTIWGTNADSYVPRFYSPTIAASDDNRFVIGWEDNRRGMMGGIVSDIWYAVRSSTGASILAPTALTNDTGSEKPILNSLTGGKVIMTWTIVTVRHYYAVIGSNGAIVKPATSLIPAGDHYQTPDAVQLPNGKVALAWVSADLNWEPFPGAELAILDSSYNRVAGPTIAYSPYHPSPSLGESLSVTTDSSSHVIMTWSEPSNRLLYVLGDSNGTFITDPMIYKTSGNDIYTTWNGQGNAPYEPGVATTFQDVQPTHWASTYIERLYAAGITGGCSANPLQYCPDGTVTRAQMAVFLLRGIHGSNYNPPAVGASTGFGDVAPAYWAAAWIKQLAADGITGGCGTGTYCPEAPVTRAQMAVFLLRSKHGASYNPPTVGGSTGFGDVPPGYWAAAWIKQLVAEGITSGCGAGTYCPEAPVTRAQMAVFLVKTFDLP